MNHSNLTLYSLTPYDRGAKARWLLTEMGVPFEERRLNRENKEHESPEFLKLNPMGRVPVLKIGAAAMFESGAICTYLADLHLEKGMAPAPASAERASYLQWMYFATAMLDTIQTRIMVIEDIPEGEVRAKKEAALLEDLDGAVEVLDVNLARSTFLVGNRFSAADISVSYHLYWCTLWPELNAVVQKFPRVVAYLERMKQVPSALRSEVFSYEE